MMRRPIWFGTALVSIVILRVASLQAQQRGASAPERLALAVATQIRQWKASDAKNWRAIPWQASLVEARRISQREGRPLFLLELDGNLDTGRC
jgi:hypothetical protein